MNASKCDQGDPDLVHVHDASPQVNDRTTQQQDELCDEPLGISRQRSSSSATSTTTALRKRPKQRAPPSVAEVKHVAKPKLDLSEPCKPPLGLCNFWNLSEIIHRFLFVGAGFDQNNKSVTVFPGEADAELLNKKKAWFESNNVKFALNMAASPKQVELHGMGYPCDESALELLSIELNDVPEWEDDMEEGYEKGASFIQKAYKEHVDFLSSEKDGVPPSIFVHCVAGVNRSPFVIVWWLVKYHHQKCSSAWDLVRKRRDVGACWQDQTLGGPMFVGGLINDANPKKAWYESMERVLTPDG